ncbi:receptor-type tyrosine-protein phosphatase H-like [Poeciliopsis prolifica]|uniref:receptor-type tyrosine-protein phosphatase H-like n=1 Tax=Poeciliopsis prolifica TaxID=188132 RepID=UPI002413E529|nr:receptor-type tyrosine-protein phosphatase H-like [Poeciliopsis prolifica]
MGNLTLLHKLCISVCLGLLLMYTAAERQYFISPHNASWADARNHCQVCFKEMVTLTPQNVHVIARIINSTHWIGLRKYINYNDTYNETDDYDYDSDYDDYNSTNSTNTSSKSFGTPWTLWANGDPLVFQNWYPGFPLFKSPLPKIDCCSCSCTCPAPPRTTTTPTPTTTGSITVSADPESSSRNSTEPNITVTDVYENMTDSTSFYDVDTEEDMLMNATEGANFTEGANLRGAKVTQAWGPTTAHVDHTTDSPWTTTPQRPILSTCDRSPMLPPVIPENNKNYIENSCVVILAFGPWVERECFEELPFICYEDRFMGAVTVSNITSSSAALQWDQGPGDISHYRFEAFSLQDSWNITKDMHNLNYTLDKLTPGTGYKITVFAVKCGRDLNPLNGSFYTIPGEVKNLSVTNFTETTVSLSWKKPDGNYGFFQVLALSAFGDEKHNKSVTKEDLVFDGLTQGTPYTFIFTTGVDDRSMWSQNISISNCTRPGEVSNLRALENKDTSLTLQWDPPKGNYTNFEVVARNESGELDVDVTHPGKLSDKPYNVTVSKLQDSTKFSFSVKVLGICGPKGKTVNITAHTAPRSVSGLNLTADATTINAIWDFTPNPGSPVNFIAKLFLNGKQEELKNTLDKKVSFYNLKTATKYEVKVFAVLNDLESNETKSSIFTLPSPPTGAKERSRTKYSLTFEWNPPHNSSANTYNCTLNSTFWDNFINHTEVQDITICRFTGLKSGSTYDFNVYTLSDGKKSTSTSCKGTTVEDPVEISLSMLCSSEEPLYCDKNETRKAVFGKLEEHFKNNLNEKVYYKVAEIPPST